MMRWRTPQQPTPRLARALWTAVLCLAAVALVRWRERA
jgi:hypothetical protein